MRGLLAKAAVHLSWLRPSHKQHYAWLAAKHHSIALPAFRSTLQHICEDNHSALIEYSFGLVWCSFAWHETFAGNTQTSSSGKRCWLPDWFYLLRGSCLIVKSCSQWITNGLHILPNLDDCADFSSSHDNLRLTTLISQLTAQTGSRTCEAVLTALQGAFARASMRHHNTPLRNAINYWIGGLPEEFIDALQREEPWTLVAMAHFSILIHRSETRWFMKGHATELLRMIIDRLNPPWAQYIHWPCEELGAFE